MFFGRFGVYFANKIALNAPNSRYNFPNINNFKPFFGANAKLLQHDVVMMHTVAEGVFEFPAYFSDLSLKFFVEIPVEWLRRGFIKGRGYSSKSGISWK